MSKKNNIFHAIGYTAKIGLFPAKRVCIFYCFRVIKEFCCQKSNAIGCKPKKTDYIYPDMLNCQPGYTIETMPLQLMKNKLQPIATYQLFQQKTYC